MSSWFCAGSPSDQYSTSDIRHALDLHVIPRLAAARRVLLVPPDGTRAKSGAGEITAILYELLAPAAEVYIMPALGTHFSMTEQELKRMFGSSIPMSRFLVHDWRNNLRHITTIEAAQMADWSENRMHMPVKVELDNILFNSFDAILSIGQIVPHEVAGMANYTKNLCVGLGGSDIINKSHYLGAVYGMERIMGQVDTPVRRLFSHIDKTCLRQLPIIYIMTVMQELVGHDDIVMRGLFIGDSDDVFEAGAALSRQVNITALATRAAKVVTWLDPGEFKSTWLGNKAVYRSRMLVADGGELIILAPGLKTFGEDPTIDRLIRKYGYCGTPAVLAAVDRDPEMRANLSAAAHLIHGSSEGRFRITYCPGCGIDHDEIRKAGYSVDNLEKMKIRYNPENLKDGFNELPDAERVFFIRNPALGLWIGGQPDKIEKK